MDQQDVFPRIDRAHCGDGNGRCGTSSSVYSFWGLSIAVTTFLLWFGVRQFRKNGKEFRGHHLIMEIS